MAEARRSPPLSARARRQALLRRALPWWGLLALGLAGGLLGVVLIVRPFESLAGLHWLVAAGLVLLGLADLLTAAASPRPALSRALGGAWLLAAVVALAWPGITLLALGVVLGLTLVVGGVIRLAVAIGDRRRDGEDRALLAIAGTTHLLTGGLALAWPSVTVLVLSLVFGISALAAGVRQCRLALRLRAAHGGALPPDFRRSPRWLRWSGAVAAMLVVLGGVVLSVRIHCADADDPGPFYSAPSPLPDGELGSIVRSEVIEAYWPGATTYRVLYRSTGFDGHGRVASGLILVPDGPAPPEGRPVVAYTHGTTGVDRRCAPSLVAADRNPLFLEGGGELLAAGYVIAASDYEGLGTAGPHPYLIGRVAAMDELDIVRAARHLDGARARPEFVVWGHSQGGHASLFTGQLAGGYAPELRLLGVAAGGPVPDLARLIQFNVGNPLGNVLISMALQSWAQVMPDAELAQVVAPAARPLVRRIARTCLFSEAQALPAVPDALLLTRMTFLSRSPDEVEPWRTIAADNTPGHEAIDVPVLIVQGLADTIIDPALTAALVERYCALGVTVDYRTYPGVGHIDTGQVAVPDVVAWARDRFAGVAAASTCP